MATLIRHIVETAENQDAIIWCQEMFYIYMFSVAYNELLTLTPSTDFCKVQASNWYIFAQHLHKKCYGGEDPTCVEGMVHLLGWIRYCCINHNPPSCEELKEENTELTHEWSEYMWCSSISWLSYILMQGKVVEKREYRERDFPSWEGVTPSCAMNSYEQSRWHSAKVPPLQNTAK